MNQTSLRTIDKMRKYLRIKLEQEIKDKFRNQWEKDEEWRLRKNLKNEYDDKLRKRVITIRKRKSKYYHHKAIIQKNHIKIQLDISKNKNEILQSKIRILENSKKNNRFTKILQNDIEKLRERNEELYQELRHNECKFYYELGEERIFQYRILQSDL